MEYFFGAGVLLLICLGTLMYYRHIAHQNFFFRRAPQLKVSEIHTFDDGWFTGLIQAPNVVIPPFFGHHTVSYSYALYEKVVRYEKDSNGNRRRVETWELYDSASDSVPFILDDGTGTLVINPRQAVHKFSFSDFYQTEHWRHTLSYIPASGIISSVGVVAESKKNLIAKGEVPLMITPMGRKSFIDAIKSEEKTSKFIGFLSLWGSLVCALYGVNEEYIQIYADNLTTFITMTTLSTLPFASFYYYFTHNTLVTLRTKVINSWANVDIELKQRRDLIPNLVANCEQYMGHEKDTLAKLVELRTSLNKEKRLKNRIDTENNITKHIEKILATAESHPQLSTETIKKLQTELVTIENKIAHAKSHFNAVAEEYNSLVEGFPSKLIAEYNKFVSVPFYGEVHKEVQKLGKADTSQKPAAVTAGSEVSAVAPVAEVKPKVTKKAS